uniref:LTD domain-containing protein n=1 Tax=Anser cygnoides TaxID=8845 RepID=A0A8B9IGK7_ANSCY
MGDVCLVGLMVLVYIWFPKVAAQNVIKNPRDQNTEHTLLINEVNADTPGVDTSEFVELYHTSGRTARLDGYYLVFYNGNGNRAYKVLNLQGKVTNGQGFFLIGSPSVNPAILIPKNTIQNGPDAIALYYGKGNYKEGMNVTSSGLVDALVHKTRKMDRADTLVSVLTPGRDAFLEDSTFRSMDESIERCRGADSQWIFQVAVPTPGTDNHCILTSQLNASAVLISEVHAASSSEDFEFIELQGPHSTMLRDIVLVLIDGQTKDIYFTMDVYGKTSSDGLLLLGPAQSKAPVDLPFPENSTHPVLRDGPNAVALYRGNISSFALGKVLPTAGLLDAFVYTNTEGVSPELLETLTLGRPALESTRHQLGNVSMSRCNCCSVTRDSLSYVLSRPTPGKFNDCPSKRFSQTVSFCLLVADCQEWLSKSEEILMTLVQAFDRSCSCGVSPAYFKDSEVACQDLGLVFTTLLTAKSEDQLSSLLLAFNTFLESPRVVSFDRRNITAESSCFKDINVPDLPPGVPSQVPEGTQEPSRQVGELLINEVNPDNPGGGEDAEYIELFYTGRTHFDLQRYCNSTLYTVNMAVTAEGLVDAVVYTSRADEKAEKLLQVLVPGQSILYENDSHSTEDESLSRCHSLSARLQSSFQVTAMTPLGENSCGGPHVPSLPAVRISELGLAGGGASGFVELQGLPGTSLDGLSLVIFTSQEGAAHGSVPLSGNLGASGLLLLGGGNDGTKLMFEDIAASEGSSAIALYSTSVIPSGMKATSENLVDALVYTCGPSMVGGHLDVLGPLYTVPCKDDRPVSLSRCPSGDASAELQFAISEPTPGVQNSCPQDAFAVGLDLCFLTPNCSAWTVHHRRTLESFRRVLMISLEEECSCGVSELYLQGLNLTCVNSVVKVSGRVRARLPMQQQSIESWRRGLLASPHPFSVDGRVLKTSPECIAPRSTPVSSQSSSFPRSWEIALLVVGALLLVLLLVGLALHLIKRRPPNYTNIEMNDCREMAADF